MSKPFNLQPLLDLAQTRTDDAARRLGELMATERDLEQKLQMLEDYRREYHERFTEAAREGLSPDAWRNFSLFIGKLDEAINAQRKVFEQSQSRTTQGQQAWIAQRGKLKAFDALSQRHRTEVAREESRSEQKQSDEHAARRNPMNGSEGSF